MGPVGAALTPAQRAHFAEHGLVRLPGAFAGTAAAMRDVVWAELERLHGIRRDQPRSWRPGRPSGLQGIKRLPVFDAIASAATCAAIDDLLGAGRWKTPSSWGFVLVSFPEDGPEWTVPSGGWHVDSDLGFAPEPLFAVRVYSFLSDVVAQGGGTAVVLGSHRLIERFLRDRGPAAAPYPAPRDFRRDFLRSDPWLRGLTRGDTGTDRVARLTTTQVVGGIPLRVAELTGRAGDVVIAHPWLLHASAPHRAAAPRMVRSKDLHRADLPPGSVVFGKRV